MIIHILRHSSSTMNNAFSLVPFAFSQSWGLVDSSSFSLFALLFFWIVSHKSHTPHSFVASGCGLEPARILHTYIIFLILRICAVCDLHVDSAVK